MLTYSSLIELSNQYASCNQYNQVYLCLQQALLYCNNETDSSQLKNTLNAMEKTGLITVKGTAIIIASYNSCYLMQKCIESIRNTLLEGTYCIVVADNGSSDEVVEWLDYQEDIILLKNEENLGFAKACNQGAKVLTGTDYEDYDVYLLNNDTRLAPGSLFWLKMGLYSDDKVGAAGSISNYAGNHQQVDVEFELPADYIKYGESINIPMDYPYEERVRLSGFSMLIRRDVWNACGGMDEDYTPGYFEDDELSMAIGSLGYKLLLCKNSFVYHAGSQSFIERNDTNELLLSHHRLFLQKHGFDILNCCYADESLCKRINTSGFKSEDSFNALVLNAGIGADMKQIRSSFANCNVIGLENNPNLYCQLSKNEIAFSSVNQLKELLNPSILHSVLIGSTAIDLLKVKMIIWDLDNTFWQGILSEGDVSINPTNVSLIKELTKRGIINSISSKNDETQVMEALSQLGLTDYFVFKNINWNPKGPQIKQKISDMNLRAANVLFIDDDARNLEEAKSYCPDIMTGFPSIISSIKDFVTLFPETDVEQTRLKNYQELEKRSIAKSSFDSNEDFLISSDIMISIHESDCINELERIAELVSRTNQLNYTKLRSNADELRGLLTDNAIRKGYVKARDKYCDYGIVGFYAFKPKEFSLSHFLFSCRIAGLGIVEKIYGHLKYPEVNTVEPVSLTLCENMSAHWIRICQDVDLISHPSTKSENKVLPKVFFKGACDLSTIEVLVDNADNTSEYNYVNEYGFTTAGMNHTHHIIRSLTIDSDTIESIHETAPFITKGDYSTALFSSEYDAIVLSLMQDYTSELYENSTTGEQICYGDHATGLTNDSFHTHWSNIGYISENCLTDNLTSILQNIKGNPKVILLLPSELPFYDEKTQAEHHKQMNGAVRQWAKDKDDVILINTTDYISSPEDYTDSITHYQRQVYFKIASTIKKLLSNL